MLSAVYILNMLVSVLLYPEVGECLVRFSHTVSIFFLLESSTFTFARSYDLVSQFLSHALTIPFTSVTYQPFDAQRYFPVRTYLRRDLEGSTTDTAASNFYSRGNIIQCFSPYLVTVFAGHLAYLIYSVIEYFVGYALLSLLHYVIHEAGHQLVVEPGIGSQR